MWDGPADAETLLILAHGAGAPMDTDFMNYFAQSLSAAKIRILRFEFPYMALRREGHGRRPPNKQNILLDTWHKIIQIGKQAHKGPIYIGGKSMGGRMASMIADESQIDGLICLGYPFYAPGKMDKPRTDHLKCLHTRTLVLQGERDVMGSKENVDRFDLSTKIAFHWLSDGDHSLKPRKKSGYTEKENLDQAVSKIVTFLAEK
ncbi:MAG: alpha/beta hydrolase [Kordiimonadaceae bacterium]|nr:alpha/beta hydrolase [Kordiimonadaceae bacterium]MBT6032441.1 alpha/beta hydrolase [Kordiimonadaceae bacterium]